MPRAYERAVVEAMCDQWPEVTSAGMRANHCILAARVAVEVAGYFGLHATERATETFVANAKGWELTKAGVPIPEWPEDAWTLGTGPDRSLSGYQGHVIVETDHYLIDLSAGQFDRPEHKLIVGGPVLHRRGPADDETWAYERKESGVVMVYKPLDDRSYRQAPDWLNPGWRQLATALIRVVRGELVA